SSPKPPAFCSTPCKPPQPTCATRSSNRCSTKPSSSTPARSPTLESATTNGTPAISKKKKKKKDKKRKKKTATASKLRTMTTTASPKTTAIPRTFLLARPRQGKAKTQMPV